MAEFQAGEVVVPVIPSAKTFTADLKRQLLPGAYKVGQDVGRDIQRGIKDSLGGVYDSLKQQSQRQQQQAPAEGAAVGGAFAQGFKRALQSALQSLPKVEVDANTSPAQAQIQQLRARMEALSSRTVGIDIDAGAAQAELAAIQRELSSIDGRAVSADLRVDVASALAELAAVEAGLSRVDGRTANARVDVDVAGALAQIGLVTAALAAIPLAASAALGVGALGGVLASAGAGLVGLAAVAAPAVGRINEALKEQEQAAGRAASGLSSAAGATRNLAIESAQAQIKQLQAANAADQMRAAQDRVKDAVAGVTTAKQRLSSAVQAAAQAQVSAAARAAQAEKSLADAQRSALKAQESLNKARRDAIKNLQDISRSLRGNALDQRQAALDLADAERDLNAARAKGNPEDIERASIAYERTQLRVEELRAEQEKLQEEQAKGVEGNDRVVSAKEAVEAANQRVIDQERQLAQAYAESGKAGEEAAKRVAEARKAVQDAEDRVDDAKRAIEQQKRQRKIAELQEKIRKEQAKDAAKRAAQTAAATQAKSGQKTAELSPAEAVAAKQIKAFKDAYEQFQKELGPAVLPVITGGLDVVAKLFKPLTPLIKGSADALVGLEKSAAKAVGASTFFKDLSTVAPTAITGLGKSLGNIGVGIAGLIRAFLPFVSTFVGGLEKATAAFATWGKNLGKSEGFRAFVGYVQANWPTVKTLFANVAAAVKNLIVGLAPLGSGALSGLSGLAGLLAKMPPETLAAIATAVGAVALGVKAWGISQKILNVALSANPIGLIITAIGLLVAGLTYAYQNSETFRQIVDAAFQAVGQAVSWAWENVIKPALEALVTFWNTVLAPALKWLWQNVIVPAWTGISTAVKVAWENVIKPALQALWTFITTVLAPKISWLWENVIKPAFAKAGEAIKAAWTLVIQPALKALWSFITETLAPKISWLYENVIKPAFSKIGQAISDAWTKVILPVFNFLKDFITKDIPNAFDKGVGMVGSAWAKIQEMAKKPVNFIIGTVYNGGIVKLWNTVADALGLELKLKEIPQLATGGIYPGYTPGRDIGLAAVSGGEAIMRPEWTRAVGPGFVDSANKAARSGGVSGAAKFMGGFANGGIIDGLIGAGVKAGSEAFLNPLLDKAAAAMGNSPWAKMLVGVPKRMIAEVVAFLTKKDAETGGLSGGKAVQYAREQIGKPYEWGATGPNSFDCSGLVMRAMQAAGRTDVPRVSQDQMKWVTPAAKPQAGMLGFPNPGHVWIYGSPNRIIEAPQTGLKVREVAARAAQLIGHAPTYDSGGFLMPGTSLVHNGTGRPEPVLTDQQWQAVQQGGTRGGDGALLNIEEFHATPEQSPYGIAKDLQFIMGTGVRARGGR
ncbi:NlpC/P60 family protein [Streptosporangium sp. CA-115845]|uniref:NlpC/P60 family protein n=1 Tax=Streptosporangium sp. CA-115845 TaxID=3240071 RepID=UPI003D8B1A7C